MNHVSVRTNLVLVLSLFAASCAETPTEDQTFARADFEIVRLESLTQFSAQCSAQAGVVVIEGTGSMKMDRKTNRPVPGVGDKYYCNLRRY